MNINTDNTLKTTKNIESTTDSSSKKENSETTESFKSFLQENNLALAQPDENLLYNMLSIYEMPYSNVTSLNMAQNIQNIKSSFTFDTRSISKEDAEFFGDLFGNKEITYTQATPRAFVNIVNEIEQTEKVHEVSKTVLNLIETAHKTSQPVRIDFDNNISVIFKVDKSGKLTAEFLPSDAAAEQYLRNNIAFLRQNLDSQNIEYNEIYYRSRKDNQNNKQRQQKQGEQDE